MGEVAGRSKNPVLFPAQTQTQSGAAQIGRSRADLIRHVLVQQHILFQAHVGLKVVTPTKNIPLGKVHRQAAEGPYAYDREQGARQAHPKSHGAIRPVFLSKPIGDQRSGWSRCINACRHCVIGAVGEEQPRLFSRPAPVPRCGLDGLDADARRRSSVLTSDGVRCGSATRNKATSADTKGAAKDVPSTNLPRPSAPADQMCTPGAATSM